MPKDPKERKYSTRNNPKSEQEQIVEARKLRVLAKKKAAKAAPFAVSEGAGSLQDAVPPVSLNPTEYALVLSLLASPPTAPIPDGATPAIEGGRVLNLDGFTDRDTRRARSLFLKDKLPDAAEEAVSAEKDVAQFALSLFGDTHEGASSDDSNSQASLWAAMDAATHH